MEITLNEVRAQIDCVDNEIKTCFKKRMELAEQVAVVKSKTSDTIFKPDREMQIIEKLTENVNQDIVMEYTALLKRIMEISRKYQYKKTMELKDGLAHLYIEEANVPEKVGMLKQELYICDTVSKDIVETYDSFAELGEALRKGEVDAGIGVFETVGRGVDNDLHGMISRNGFFIQRCDVVEDSGARKKVITFSREFSVREDDNRLKLMFVCPNRGGSLAAILSMIADYGVNLTEIHSHPNSETEWNYEFFAEIEANYRQPDIQALVFQLENETDKLSVMGSYRCEGDF